MLRRSQDIISAYLTNTYEQFLNEKCILTSITKPKNKTNSVVDVIGRFEPIVKRKKYANNPYYKKYVAQPDGENGPTYIAENGEVEVIYPDL